ncbi:MAG: hypothetical protein GWN30_07600 [Gammaproteobacteria bacterium]|nr:hypothetical protein [Gammaproteobacteria bacterium]
MIDNLLYWASFPLFSIYTLAMLKMDIQWNAHMPKGPKIIVANHPSTTDPFYLSFIAKTPSNILIKDHVFRVPFLGLYLKKSGHIPVIEGQGRRAFNCARINLIRGRTIILFPEGSLSPEGGGYFKPRTGAARLALLSGAPVVPVGIHFPQKNLNVSPGTYGGKQTEARYLLRGPYHMTVGESMNFSGDMKDRNLVVSIAEQIMNRIIELAEQSTRRMQAIPTI